MSLVNQETFMYILAASIMLLIVVQWFCWIFQLGRFKPGTIKTVSSLEETQHIRYIVANLFVNIINDFRHLLALVIVLVFAITLFVVLYKNTAAEIGTAMQSVSSTFGGLIGAIIGFYFGEKTASGKNDSDEEEIEEQTDILQQGETEETIISIPELERDKS